LISKFEAGTSILKLRILAIRHPALLPMNEIETPENSASLRDYKEGFEVRHPNH